jgi:hypothetical protein
VHVARSRLLLDRSLAGRHFLSPRVQLGSSTALHPLDASGKTSLVNAWRPPPGLLSSWPLASFYGNKHDCYNIGSRCYKSLRASTNQAKQDDSPLARSRQTSSFFRHFNLSVTSTERRSGNVDLGSRQRFIWGRIIKVSQRATVTSRRTHA